MPYRTCRAPGLADLDDGFYLSSCKFRAALSRAAQIRNNRRKRPLWSAIRWPGEAGEKASFVASDGRCFCVTEDTDGANVGPTKMQQSERLDLPGWWGKSRKKIIQLRPVRRSRFKKNPLSTVNRTKRCSANGNSLRLVVAVVRRKTQNSFAGVTTRRIVSSTAGAYP